SPPRRDHRSPSTPPRGRVRCGRRARRAPPSPLPASLLRARYPSTRRSPRPLLRPIACAYPRSRMPGFAVEAPMQGTIVSVDVRPGDVVHPGQQLLVIESMKMEHVISAESGGEVTKVVAAPGDTVNPGDVLVRLNPHSGGGQGSVSPLSTARTQEDRADLSEVVERHAVTRDERRPE